MFPWGFQNYQENFYPPEEFQVSRVEINENTGKEVITHYSHAKFAKIPFYTDEINYFQRF